MYSSDLARLNQEGTAYGM